MDTQELAQHLYREWARLMDIIEPQEESYEAFSAALGRYTAHTDRIRPRVHWNALTERQRDVWLAVAGAASRITAAVP